MNNYTPQGFYQPINIIEGFRQMAPDALAVLRAQLELTIGVGELIFCQNRYKAHERRDPSVPELLFLDAIISQGEKKPSSLLLSEIKCNDPAIADTFSDLQSKLHALKKKPPYSFGDISAAADTYLARAGKKTATPGIYGKCADFGRLEFAAKGCRELARPAFADLSSACSIGIPTAPAHSKAFAAESDSFVVLYPFDDDLRDFSETVARLFTDGKIANAIKRADTAELGVFDFMIDSAKGFYADITHFPKYEENPVPSLLTLPIGNAVVALVDGKAVMDLAHCAQENGINFAAFGRPLNLSKISVRYENGYPMTLNADFIRSIRFTAPLRAADDCFGISAESKEELNGVLCREAGEIIYSAASTGDASMKDTANTILSTVAPLIARGVGFSEISVSFDARLPLLSFNESNNFRALSMLLGQYRVQAELCLLSEGSRYICDKSKLSLASYARARIPKKTVSDKVTRSEGDLFLMAPARSQDGLFDFDSLRKLFDLIVSLIEDGRAVAVRAVGKEGLKKAIFEMTETYDISDYSLPEELADDQLCTFIVESNENLPGLKLHYRKNTPNEL